MHKISLMAALALPLQSFAGATDYLDTVLVSGSRTPSTLGKVGSAVTVIDRSSFDFRQAQFVTDLLRQVAGITLSNAGGIGKQTQLRMRGAEGNHVMVMIDGVEANDLAGNDEFEFGNLSTADIERIEVVRGPQSSLWGSDALAGVINVITRRAEGPPRVELGFEGGAFGTHQERGSVGVARGRGQVRVGFNRVSSAGANVARQGDEDDAYHATTVNLNSSMRVNDAFDVALTMRNVESRNQVDTDFITGLPTDSPGVADTYQRYLGTHARLALAGGRWLQQVDGNWSATGNDNVDPTVFQDSSTDGERYELTYQSTLLFDLQGTLPSSHSVTLAMDHEHDRFEQRAAATPFGDPNQTRGMDATGLVGEYRVDLPHALSLSGSVRHDFNSDFRNVTTWRSAAVWRYAPSGTSFNFAYGTGQKAPTFIERFGYSSGGQFGPTFVGNQGLEPEQSRGWEVGITQALFAERLRLTASYFRERLTDEIFGFFVDATGTTATAINQNGTSRRDGVELSYRANLPWHFALGGSYTYLDATELDRATGLRKDEVRRPRHQVSGTLDWSGLDGRLRASAWFNHAGRQEDLAFLAPSFQQQRARLAPYSAVGATLSYDLTSALELYSRCENLLDSRYEQVLGYRAPGIAVYAGFKLAFELP